MDEASATLRRWHMLPRADRKAILARLDDDQRRGLMTMIEAHGRTAQSPRGSREAAAGWAMFSPSLAHMLRALEASDAPPTGLRITPAAAELLLLAARDLRDGSEKEEGWLSKAGRRWRQWLKDMDL